MFQLGGIDGQRNHDLQVRVVAFIHQLNSGAEEGTELHLGDFGVDDTQTYTTQTHHRVHLVHTLDAGVQLLEVDAAGLGHLALFLLGLRYELMQRGIHQAEGEGLAVHHFQRTLGALTHIGLQLGQSGLAGFQRVGQNHVAKLLQRHLAVLPIEHMLNAEQADTFGTEIDSLLSVGGVVGIGADTHLAELVHQLHELLEQGVLCGVNHLHLFIVHPALRTVEAQQVAFVEHLTIDGHSAVLFNVDFLLTILVGADGGTLHLNLHGIATHDAALAPAAGHEGCMRGHTATGGEDTVGGTHALDVLGVGLLADEDILNTGSLVFLGFLAGEGNHTHSTAGTCGQTLGQHLVFLLVSGIQNGVQQLVELGGRNAHHHLALVNQAFLQHVHSHGEGSHAGAFAHAALQHIELAVLDGKLDVEHVVEVLFQSLANVAEFFIGLGHQLLHGVHVLVLLVLGFVVQGVGCTDTGHDILALGVDKPFAVELVVAGGRVAGESHAGGAVVAHVAEHHGLHIDSGAPIVGNTLNLAVADSLLAVPALEHGFDTAFHLSFGIIGELGAEHLFHLNLESVGQLHQVLGSQLGVALIVVLSLVIVQHIVQLLADALAVGGLNALALLHHHIGVHHNQTTIGVVNKAGVVGSLQHAGDCLGRKADIQHGVHHAGHRATGTRAAAHQQRVLGIVIFHTHQFLHVGHGFPHIVHQACRQLAVVLIISSAAFCCNSQTSGDGKTQQTHFSQIGTFTAEQVFHVGFTLGSLAAKRVNKFRHLLNVCILVKIFNCPLFYENANIHIFFLLSN